jgi:hypothetical protein
MHVALLTSLTRQEASDNVYQKIDLSKTEKKVHAQKFVSE